MAFTVTNLNTATDPGPISSRGITNVTASVGDLLIIVCQTSNSGSSGAAVTVTVADNSAASGAANTYTQRTQVNKTGGVVDDGTTLTMFTCIVTRPLSANTITCSFSPLCNQGVAVGGYRFAPGSGEAALYVEAGSGATGNSTTPSITSGTIVTNDTIVAALATEGDAVCTGDSDTTRGNWSTQYGATSGGGGGVLEGQFESQWKTVTSDGTQTYNPTLASAQDWAVNYIVVRAVNIAISALIGTGFSLPVRQTIAPALAIALAASGPVEPGRPGQSSRSIDWYSPLNSPVQVPRRNPAALANYQAFTPAQFTETVYYDKYAFPWAEPVRLKIGLNASLQVATTGDTTVLPVGQIFPYYQWFAEPVRLPRGLPAYLQQWYHRDVPTTPTPIGFYYDFSLPIPPDTMSAYKIAIYQAIPSRILPPVDVTATMAATESSVDVALIGVEVYDSATPATSTGDIAIVSIYSISATAGGLGAIQGD